MNLDNNTVVCTYRIAFHHTCRYTCITYSIRKRDDRSIDRKRNRNEKKKKTRGRFNMPHFATRLNNSRDKRSINLNSEGVELEPRNKQAQFKHFSTFNQYSRYKRRKKEICQLFGNRHVVLSFTGNVLRQTKIQNSYRSHANVIDTRCH